MIEAKQGAGNTPAYRGTAYVVFEGFALEKYGNRIPQLSFEVIRVIGELEKHIRSISIIPGATEYGYEVSPISNGGQDALFENYNRHTSVALSDWEASIDELQMVCPNLESVSLVVSWYGTDLRAGECLIRPRVTHRHDIPWNVATYDRQNAHLVSTVDEKASFGGTPTDASIKSAIADLKERGLRVTIYPFLLMDIPQENTLAWKEASGQPAYPWRGDISCYPPPESDGTVDKTDASRIQLDVFSAEYKAMILHFAHVCADAGGVDGFLIGSELRGLTRIRDGAGNFPFVETLIDIAALVRPMLGTGCQITYGADWSEYFGYQPTDGSGDVLYNLDALWASDDITCIGIDNYMPLSDLRHDGDPSFPSTASVHSKDYLKNNIAAGEGFDWFYASADDRNQRKRTPITGRDGEEWIYRYKDLVSWWSTPHHERLSAVRQAEATAWVPRSKPIVLTELGCPAIDAGSNQPNVFYDPKSAQSALPYFSNGNRDDLMQRNFLEAHYEFWNDAKNNPVSDVYGGSMIDPAQIAPWAWDARPFPWFPISLDTWSDGDNWHRGHWLSGRLGSCSVAELIAEILKDYGHAVPVSQLSGILDGYVIPDAVSAREALEPLLGLYDIFASEESGQLVFRDLSETSARAIDSTQIIQEGDQPAVSIRRTGDSELPEEAIIHHGSVFSDYEDRGTKSRRLEGASNRQVSLHAPIVLPQGAAVALADRYLQKKWSGREEMSLSLPVRFLDVCVGDILSFTPTADKRWLVLGVDTGVRLELTLRSVERFELPAFSGAGEIAPQALNTLLGPPSVMLMDLPLLPGRNQTTTTHVAVSAVPWGRGYSVLSSPSQENFSHKGDVDRQAVMGTVISAVGAGAVGRWDYAHTIQLALPFGTLQSVEPLYLFIGANLLAVESRNRKHELIQFRKAEIQSDGTWHLSELLRGQLGTETETAAEIEIGARAVLLDDAVQPVQLDPAEYGIELNWRVGPYRHPVASDVFTQQAHTNLGRDRMMLSAAHLTSQLKANGDLFCTWIRRSRLNADSWIDPEIPLDAAREAYRVRIVDQTGKILREETVTEPQYTYAVEHRSNDFGSGLVDVKIQVAQISDNALPGFDAVITENLT